jgi:hypothetical protein
VGHPRVRRLRKKPAAGSAIRKESVADEAPTASAVVSRELVSLPAHCQIAQGNRGPVCSTGQDGTQEAADRQRRAASVTVARFARGTPRALVAFGPWALIVRIACRLSGRRASRDQSGASCAWAIIDELASSIRQPVAAVLYAHEPPRSTRCSGNASANGVSEPGIWTQAARCIRSPQGGRTEVSNASPFFGRTRQVAQPVRAAIHHCLRWFLDRDPARRCISARCQDLAVSASAFAASPSVWSRKGRCLAIRPPLRPLRHPWGALRDFCHPGVRFLQSFVEWRCLARDCVRPFFSEGTGCAGNHGRSQAS